MALVPLVPIAASLAPATPPTPEKWLSEPSTAQAEELTSISEQQLDPFEQRHHQADGRFGHAHIVFRRRAVAAEDS